MNILVWNLNNSQAANQVASLARHEDIDVLLLLECIVPPTVMLETLQRVVAKRFYLWPTEGNRMGVYTRFPRRYVALETPRVEQRRCLFLRVQPPAELDILLVLVHAHQVLVRPELVPRLSPDSVRILIKAGQEPLLTASGHPRVSDHLPLFFRLDLG